MTKKSYSKTRSTTRKKATKKRASASAIRKKTYKPKRRRK